MRRHRGGPTDILKVGAGRSRFQQRIRPPEGDCRGDANEADRADRIQARDRRPHGSAEGDRLSDRQLVARGDTKQTDALGIARA